MEMKGFFLCDQIKADLHITWVLWRKEGQCPNI